MHAQWKRDMGAYDHLERHDRLITAWLHTFDEMKCVWMSFGDFPSIFVGDFDDGCHSDKTGAWEDIKLRWKMSGKKKNLILFIIT